MSETLTPVSVPARTRTPDPYAPIEKRSLWTTDSMRSAGYSVRRADPDSPTGWAECGVVSEDYLVIPNADVRDLAHEIAHRSGLAFDEDQVFFDGKRYALSLVAKQGAGLDGAGPDGDGLDGAGSGVAGGGRNPFVETRVGDYVGLGLRFENSYDGSRRFSASLFAYRLACSNGMLAPELFRRVTFKHTRSSRDWEADAQRALAMIGGAHTGLARFGEAARALASMRVSASRLREIRTAVLPKLPVTLWGTTMDRFLEHESLDGFGLLNAVTNVTWHAARPTAAAYAHNEYATSALVRYALGADRAN